MTDHPPYSILIDSEQKRAKALEAVRRAPTGYVMTLEIPVKPKTRPQENKFHALLRDIAAQVTRGGEKYAVEEWKKLMCDSLRRESKIVPSLDGSGFVDLGWASTSRLSERQYADLILIAQAYGDQHGVKFKADAGLEPTRA